jgi:hypothetical protein
VSSDAKSVAHDVVFDLFSKIIGPFAATLVSPLLNEPDNIEERVGVLVLQLQAHPHLIMPFRKYVASLQNKEPMAALEEQIRFYTTWQSRNYLFTILLNDVLQLKELQLDLETGRLPGKASDLLKYSFTARMEFGEESRYKDLMCTAGLLFDFVFYLQKSTLLNLNGAKFDEIIETSFKTGVEQGKLIIRLSRYKKKLTYEKYAPVAALLRQLSHVILHLLFPTVAPDFYKNLSAIRYTEPLKLALEKKEFGIDSATVASLIAQSFTIFNPLGDAMSVFGYPHLAHYVGEEAIQDLAGIAELGILLKETFKPGDITSSGTVGESIPELKFLDYVLGDMARAELSGEGGKS